ncbi:MAG TPA: hypothetical protein VFG23_19800 [Polyangia bacterium]|nr:hypothetical protein [Polyangia bacterium]
MTGQSLVQNIIRSNDDDVVQAAVGRQSSRDLVGQIEGAVTTQEAEASVPGWNETRCPRAREIAQRRRWRRHSLIDRDPGAPKGIKDIAPERCKVADQRVADQGFDAEGAGGQCLCDGLQPIRGARHRARRGLVQLRESRGYRLPGPSPESKPVTIAQKAAASSERIYIKGLPPMPGEALKRSDQATSALEGAIEIPAQAETRFEDIEKTPRADPGFAKDEVSVAEGARPRGAIKGRVKN